MNMLFVFLLAIVSEMQTGVMVTGHILDDRTGGPLAAVPVFLGEDLLGAMRYSDGKLSLMRQGYLVSEMSRLEPIVWRPVAVTPTSNP